MGLARILRSLTIVTSTCAFLGGCIEAKIAVTVQPDGTGRREVEIAWELESLQELELSVDGFQELLDLQEASGWSASRETRWADGGERTFLVFRRTLEIESLEGWPRQGGDIDIRAGKDDPRFLGHTVRAGNEVSVELARSGHGRSITYRETFRIEGMKELMDQFQSERFASQVAQAFPQLTEADRAELRGLYFGHLALQRSLYGQDDEDPDQIQKLADSLARHARRVVENRAPGVETGELDRLARNVLVDEDEALDQHLVDELPGVLIAALFGIKLEVTMPGEVVDTNADQRSEGYVAWEFQLWSAIDEPVQLFVRAEMPEGR